MSDTRSIGSVADVGVVAAPVYFVPSRQPLRFPVRVTIVRQRSFGGTVLRSISLVLAAVVLVAVPNNRLSAQENETTVTLTVGPSFVDFGFGSFGAAVARLSIS